MKKFAGLIAFVILLMPGFAAAADIQVSDSFPEGHVLNPTSNDETLVFGDVSASIVSNEVDEEGNRTVQIQIDNNLRTGLWIEPTYLLGFGEGRYLGDARVDEGAEAFSIVSMETESGTAEVAYEWFMSIDSGSSGTVTLEMSSVIEKVCYKPFASNASELLEDSDTRIHGCWLLDGER